MQDLKWDLTPIFKGFDTDEFKNSLKNVETKLKTFKEMKLSDDFKTSAAGFIDSANSLLKDIYPLAIYSNLVFSADSSDETAFKMMNKLDEIVSELTGPFVRFQKWLSKYDASTIRECEDPVVREHEFSLLQALEESRYLLSDDEEILLSKLQTVGSGAWSSLQTKLTSELMIDFDMDGQTKQMSLSMIRNLANHESEKVRKSAYEAELKAYERIDESVAAALNAIKGEVNMISSLRGFGSPLEESAFRSKLDIDSIHAMFEAIEAKLPVFRKYLKRKAELLGHKDGLPFYDLFAPAYGENPSYTYEEAKEFIIKNFRTFSDDLADFAKGAFENEWIDVYPRKGKTGGAFCAYIDGMKQSRVLTNFDGTFSSVSTLAHELGHAYHNSCIYNESMLNSEYPMPVAETASIFCETIVTQAALKELSDEQAAFILEKSIENSTQIIVDIYSRYLFEESVFINRKNGPLSVRELKDLMRQAQLKTYGDGLDPDHLHPFMWMCKSHYYSSGFSFYNYPYAFGLLFGKGIYAAYSEGEKDFPDKYKKLLNSTVKKKAADVAAVMDIDIRDMKFWTDSLSIIEKEIENFIFLTADKV